MYKYEITAEEERKAGLAVSPIQCTITFIDKKGKTLYTKTFPLPQKTFKALKHILGVIEYYLQERIEQNDPLNEDDYKILVKFYNVPKEIKVFLEESALKQFFYTLSGKTPPLGIPFIVRALKRRYKNLEVEVEYVV